jgi:hypothetical protein
MVIAQTLLAGHFISLPSGQSAAGAQVMFCPSAGHVEATRPGGEGRYEKV